MDDNNTKRMRWWWPCAGRLWAGAVICAAGLNAQVFTLDPLTPGGVQQRGVHLYNFSVYSSYSTVDESWINLVNTLTGSTGPQVPNYTTSSGVTTSIGFHFGGVEGGRSNFSAVYSPTYSYDTYGQSSSEFTQTLSLMWSRKLAPRWSFSVSLSGAEGQFQQLLFSPTNAQNIASLAGTAQELSGQFLTGQTTSSSISAGTGASAAVNPQLQFLYGDRLLTAAMGMGLSYSYSPRLNFSVSVSGNRIQHLKDSAAVGSDYYASPQSTSGGASAGFSYLLSERTSFMGSVGYGREIGLYGAQSASGQLGLGRRITPHWFTTFGAGGGYILPNGLGGAGGKEWEASASVGYRSRSQTLFADASREVSDIYGTGAAATLTADTGWNMRVAGSAGSLQAGVGLQRLLGQPALADLSSDGFHVNAGVYRSISRRATMVIQYVYASFSGVLPSLSSAGGQTFKFAQNSVRLSFGFGGGPGGQGAPGGAP